MKQRINQTESSPQKQAMLNKTDTMIIETMEMIHKLEEPAETASRQQVAGWLQTQQIMETNNRIRQLFSDLNSN